MILDDFIKIACEKLEDTYEVEIEIMLKEV